MKKFLFTLLFLALPATALAASPSLLISAPAQPVAAGDTILVPIMLSVPDAAGINALAASVHLSGPAQLTGVLTGGSVFTLWPEGPDVSATRVTFVGGTPGSVYGTPLKAVTLVIATSGTGEIALSASGTAYIGDGKGSPEVLKATTRTFSVGAAGPSVRDEYAGYLAKDTTAPEPFSIELGRDPSLYDDAYFISFTTSDTGTGVVRYEVSEKGAPVVSATSTYVLADQSLKSAVTVRAIDASGNVRSETLAPASSWRTYLWVALALVILISLGYIYLRRSRMRY